MSHQRDNDESYLSRLERLLSQGKKPAELIPFKRDLKTFTEYFLPFIYGRRELLGLTLGNILLLAIWHAKEYDLTQTALELGGDYTPAKIRYQLRAIRRKLGLKARSSPMPKRRGG